VADVGELVKLGDGRWARYQHCPVVSDGRPSGIALLVAVELDERTQRLLDAAEFTTGIDAPAQRDDSGASWPREAPEALSAAVH
jgi:hypothetical protein